MNEIKDITLLGAHMSTEGGLYRAIERGASIACTTIQIFTSSNRQWYKKPLTQEEIIFFKKTKKNTNISSIVAHCSYLINLASDKKAIREKSILSLAEEIKRCALLEIPFLVLHPGSKLTNTLEQACTNIASGIDQAYEQANTTSPTILLETMAGQGSSVGSSFSELKKIMQQVKNKKIGVCFDTCHAFAAGYKFDTQVLYEDMWQKFEAEIGIKYLQAFHINDSKKECGSKVDRHEMIGKGLINIDAFKLIMSDKRFINIPKILETPKTSLDDDLKNINLLKKLIKK